MPFRINLIHVKAADPRKTADWWVGAGGENLFLRAWACFMKGFGGGGSVTVDTVGLVFASGSEPRTTGKAGQV